MVRVTKKKVVTSGGTPQPAFGTTLSAAIAAWDTSTVRKATSYAVADSSDFRVGDWALLMEVDGTLAERHKVEGIVDGTHVTIMQPANAHASGAFVILSVQANSVYIQTTDGNTGAIFIGTAWNMVKATFVFVIAQLAKVSAGSQPVEFSSAQTGAVNGGDTSQYWIDGTTGDGFVPSFTVI